MLPNTPRIRSRLDILYLVTREFNARLDIDQVLQRVLSATVASVGAYDASLLLFDAEGNSESFLLSTSFEVQQRRRPRLEAIMERGVIAWVKAHREGVLIKDTNEDERWYKDKRPELSTSRSAVAVPIQLPEQLIGVLTITSSQPDQFDENDMAMLSIIADQAAFAIANARLFKAEQRRHRLADTLASVAHTINATLDLNETLALILEQLALVIDYDSSSILLLEGDTLYVRAVRGFEDMDDALLVKIPLDDTNRPNYRAILQKKPILINDVDAEPNWIKSSSSQKVRSWIGAPLITQDEVIGMLTVESHTVNQYTQENVQEVAAFADHAATAVANAQTVALLRSMEDSYTTLFEDSADMIILTDYHGQILNANRKTCLMLRRTKDALVGNDISLVGRRLKEALVEHSKRLQTWREVVLEVEIVDAYREPISLEISARQVRYGNKDCVQWVGRDVSGRKESEKMRQDLINMIVHDLRGPVGNLINTIEMLPMLIDFSEDPKIQNFLELAKHSGQEVRDLVDSMLDVGRLEGGEIYLQRSRVDLSEIIQAVQDQVAPRVISKQMALIFKPLPEIPPVWIDRSMIRRVLINLVDNAIKYTQEQGQVFLTITLEGDTLCFAVADNGSGISKDYQAHIFNKFSRIDYSSNAPAGVGLGLAFCKLAVEAHGGSIWVESDGIPGQGSTFYFTLPLLTPPEEE